MLFLVENFLCPVSFLFWIREKAIWRDSSAKKKHSLAEQFRQIKRSLAEQFRQIKRSLVEQWCFNRKKHVKGGGLMGLVFVQSKKKCEFLDTQIFRRPNFKDPWAGPEKIFRPETIFNKV